MKSNQKCIITGGAGFIGSHLCENLIKKGYEVYCLDNLVTGFVKNIKHLKSHPQFHFIECDVVKPVPDKLKSLNGVSHVYHLASPASPPQYIRLSIETLLVNSLGTYNMLKLARHYHATFLLASTSEVYGNPLNHPQKESYFGNVNPIGIRSCYDESKRFAESLSMEFFRKFKTKIRIVRIFNTYGPNMSSLDGRVISNFITQAITDSPLTIYGTGFQTRSFCYISDMVSAIILAANKKNIDGEVINLGNPDEKTIEDIARLILKLSSSKSIITYTNKRLQNDPDRRKPEIGKANKLLGWRPRLTLEEGLKKTIEYFRHL